MPRRILLAVSGGPDSLALVLACTGDVGFPRSDVFVATVDHSLRPESAAEARFVGEVCRTLGLSHRVLRWERPLGAGGNLQAQAREARYRLLTEEARRVGAAAILTAHHQDDQIETHLMARERGARDAALAGMRVWRDLEPGVVLLRPFLDSRKADLRRELDASGLQPVEDPTNVDFRYRRARMRAALEESRFDRKECLAAIKRAEALRLNADARLRQRIVELVAVSALAITDAGEIRLPCVDVDSAGLHLLSRAVTAAGGALYPPSKDCVARLAACLQSGAGRGATLSGCRTERRGAAACLGREYGRTGLATILVQDRRGLTIGFDRRFDVALGNGPLEGDEKLAAFGSLDRGNSRHRTLPVLVGRDGAVLAAHSALAAKLPKAPRLAATCRLGWRIWADLPGSAPAGLTAVPQNAANPIEPVGKDLADTYLR